MANLCGHQSGRASGTDAPLKRQPRRKEQSMKLTSTGINQVLSQIRARAIPDNDPMLEQFMRRFGDHTFFADEAGLNIVEPQGSDIERKTEATRLVKLASWR